MTYCSVSCDLHFTVYCLQSQLRDFLSGAQCAVHNESSPQVPASPVRRSQDDEQVPVRCQLTRMWLPQIIRLLVHCGYPCFVFCSSFFHVLKLFKAESAPDNTLGLAKVILVRIFTVWSEAANWASWLALSEYKHSLSAGEALMFQIVRLIFFLTFIN